MSSLYIYFKPIFIVLSVSVLNAACGGGTSGTLNTGNTNSVVQPPSDVNISVPENTVSVRNFSAAQSSDAANLGLDVNSINSVIFSISGGVDQAAFSMGQNDSNDYILFFTVSPDFEIPEDADKDNVYELEVKGVTSTASATQKVRVAVTDVFDKLNVVNDTGITLCGDYSFDDSTNSHNNIVCSAADPDGDPVPDKQDAKLGRDYNVSLVKIGSGVAGFDFTKLDSAGAVLPLATGSWSCVQDNHTNLIWEVKQTAGIHKSTDTYTWLNNTTTLNGGAVGAVGIAASCSLSLMNCNTEAYVAEVNKQGLCGAKDWRLPTAEELQGILHYGAAASPLIDADYFNNTNTTAPYWAVSPSSSNSANAWVLNFSNGSIAQRVKATAAAIRLVRGAR